jgi:glucose-6-phosphate-specific signal transduction histidine kinase
VGIDPDKIYHQDSFGLLGMREKAKSMGGEVTIRNLGLARNGEGEDQDSMFGGTEVILSVPHNGKISGDKL